MKISLIAYSSHLHFVPERKQIALPADEKMPAGASHRLLVINRSEMRVKMIVNDAESREHKRFSAVSRAIQSILIPTLIVLVVIMMIQIKHLQGTARVINYAGLVRGATQRLVKLEIIGIHDDELVQYLDDILEDLKYDGDSYGLVSLEDVNYQGKLDSMIDYWEKLKKEIKKARDCDYEATDIVAMSETYFGLADETVSAAEAYSDKAAKQMRLVELLSVVDMLILFLLIIEQSLSSMRIIRKNRILEQKAYIDVHTGLPNKSKCEELFSDMSFITEPTACLMFDLNNLKSANDTLGHSAGDQLIASFARVLRNVIPAKDFVGRYGGDEFVVILYDITENTVNSLLTQLHNEVMQFNRCGNNIPISYAQGWAVSTDYTDCTLRTLFDKADHFMYTNKVKVKSK